MIVDCKAGEEAFGIYSGFRTNQIDELSELPVSFQQKAVHMLQGSV